MLQFNAQGYLEPFEAIATELTTAKEFFTWNEHRKNLWQNFEAFTTELQNILQTNFTIWLNGSFVTQKEIPNDLDLVSFIDYRKYDRIVLDLLEIKQKYRPQKIDSYFVPNYPEKHKKSYLTELDKKDW
ncbi:MAG: hypothetical protein NZ516_09810, partial [Raineya sp.]|nr:hypothetical protein [Raineya sp.]